MDNAGDLKATVTRERDSLTIAIDEAHRARAGLARIECWFADQPSPAGSATEPVHTEPATVNRQLPDAGRLAQLRQDLQQQKEYREAVGLRLHELTIRKLKYGSSFSAGEAVELREAEEEACHIDQRILDLEAQIRAEAVGTTHDPRPGLTRK